MAAAAAAAKGLNNDINKAHEEYVPIILCVLFKFLPYIVILLSKQFLHI